MIHVAVAIISQNDKILIAKRPDHLEQGGFWEFPGGKVEKNESVFRALCRECAEELDIEIISASPKIKLTHQYPNKKVLLDIWQVNSFLGKAYGKEQQQILWADLAILSTYRFLEANKPIISLVSELKAEYN